MANQETQLSRDASESEKDIHAIRKNLEVESYTNLRQFNAFFPFNSLCLVYRYTAKSEI